MEFDMLTNELSMLFPKIGFSLNILNGIPFISVYHKQIGHYYLTLKFDNGKIFVSYHVNRNILSSCMHEIEISDISANSLQKIIISEIKLLADLEKTLGTITHLVHHLKTQNGISIDETFFLNSSVKYKAKLDTELQSYSMAIFIDNMMNVVLTVENCNIMKNYTLCNRRSAMLVNKQYVDDRPNEIGFINDAEKLISFEEFAYNVDKRGIFYLSSN